MTTTGSNTTTTTTTTGTLTDEDGVVTTTVDGIRTVLAPRSGLLSAGLVFRVGRADETLATSGVTHLVEHLALYRQGMSDGHHNGATTATFTHFHVTGTPAEVVAYLNGVCASLRDLPMDRLETEKEILRTEAAGRVRGPAHLATLWRYGARSYGLTGYAETGLRQLTGDTVRDWARTRFTAGNAVLWITGDTVPEGLDLALPSGEWHPAPEATSALPVLPAYFQGDDGAVVLTSVLPRSTGASLFAEVLGKELLRDLRHKSGYSYTATAEYSPRDAGSATVVAYADALPHKQDAMVGAFVDVLAKLRAGRIEPADLEAVRASALARLNGPELASARLPGQAVDLLLRHRHLTVAEARAEIEAVTVEALHEVARALWAGALMQVPGRGVDWAGLAVAPTGSEEVVTGRAHPSLADPGTVLTVAADGVSLVTAANRITVRYAECSLVQAYPDGARHLVGHDGFTLTIEPALFGITAADLAPLDASVPPSVVLAMPPRDPARIPRPPQPAQPAQPTRAAAPEALPAAPQAPPAVWFTVLLWVLGVPGVLIGGSTLVLGIVMGDEHGQIAQDNAKFLFDYLLVAGAFLIPWGVCMNRRIKGKN
ncbi:insulinase family protein [Streptomyces sp. ISL-43]|uniref:M16 family metallopeptidase n=1 Tax=Streptomyces sp. ISL-43 TaxID=2819183 RepID=UPI001BE8D299|nr:insulinase family protein [Streptomyces sp. ISL-43]MBT2445813.1 insulinase family protein [Streptomyces sp. ISL-43]